MRAGRMTALQRWRPSASVGKVLPRAPQRAGTARPHLLRISGARKTVVAVAVGTATPQQMRDDEMSHFATIPQQAGFHASIPNRHVEATGVSLSLQRETTTFAICNTLCCPKGGTSVEEIISPNFHTSR